MRPLDILVLKRLRILVCVMLVAESAYSQTADSPKGASSKSAAAQSTPPVSNSALAERPAPTPATTQNQSAKEVALSGVEVTDPKADQTEVALGKFVILKLDTPWEVILKQQTPTNKLGLFINDLFMKGLEPMPMPEHPNWVMFQLKRNDDNREAWSVLFGRKSFFFGTRQNDEIALTIGLQDGSWGAKNRTCWRSGNSDLSQLLQNAINWVRGPNPAVSVNGAGLIEAFAWETEPGYALHLLNYTNPNTMHGSIRNSYPLGPQQVRFRVNEGHRIKAVRALRAATTLKFQQKNETITFEVPGIADFEVVVLV